MPERPSIKMSDNVRDCTQKENSVRPWKFTIKILL